MFSGNGASLMSNFASILSGVAGAGAASDAAYAQYLGYGDAIKEQRDLLKYVEKLYSPYTEAGTNAIDAYSALSGLSGEDGQQAQINQIMNSPLFKSLLSQGENAILRNASASGGLRGGNTQAALAMHAPNLLGQQIASQYGVYNNLIGHGLNATNSVGNTANNVSNLISKLLSQQGEMDAAQELASGQITQSVLNGIGGIAKSYASSDISSGFGG